jgi:predicted NBD/HSP70 family sugar kinase
METLRAERVVCLIGSGVGASIIVNGAVLRGSTASAG